MSKAAICPLLFLLALNACGDGGNEPGPGGVSAEDAKALDEAAEKLDSETRQPAEVISAGGKAPPSATRTA